MPPLGYADLSHLSENDRIRLIGKQAMEGPASSADKPRIIGFYVETTEKADRYVRKLKRWFPGIREIDRTPVVQGVHSVVLVRVGPPAR